MVELELQLAAEIAPRPPEDALIEEFALLRKLASAPTPLDDGGVAIVKRYPRALKVLEWRLQDLVNNLGWVPSSRHGVAAEGEKPWSITMACDMEGLTAEKAAILELTSLVISILFGDPINAVTVNLLAAYAMTSIARHRDRKNVGRSFHRAWARKLPLRGAVLEYEDGQRFDVLEQWNVLPPDLDHWVTPLLQGERCSLIAYQLPPRRGQTARAAPKAAAATSPTPSPSWPPELAEGEGWRGEGPPL